MTEPTYTVNANIFDPDGRLCVMRADDLVIIARRGAHLPAEVERLPGTHVLIVGGSEVKAEFSDWVSEQMVEDIQRALGTGWGTASRLRKALGLATQYGRQSRTTQWRRKKAQS